MLIGVPRDTAAGQTRGAGVAASASDSAYGAAGAEITDRSGAFACDLISRAHIAGHKTVMMAADKYQRLFPMLITAAGGGANAPNT